MATAARATFCGTLALLLAACSPGEPAVDTGAGERAGVAKEAEASVVRPVVVMLGDSLTAGYGLAPEEALPDQIQAALRTRGVAARFVNAGVSGDTTRGGFERYDWSVKGSGADVLLIALGANDFLGGLSAEQARQNLDSIITRAQADGLRVALVGVAMRAPGPVRDPRETAFAEVYAALAKDRGVALFPDMLAAVGDRPALLQPDGLHPTAEGVRAMAASLTDFVSAEVAAWNATR
jgi:acyl-CoA thioesterase-1